MSNISDYKIRTRISIGLLFPAWIFFGFYSAWFYMAIHIKLGEKEKVYIHMKLVSKYKNVTTWF